MARRRLTGNEERERLLARGTDDHYIDADLYDFEYRERDEDIDWYRGFVAEQAAGPVLELGAGSGRITIPLLADGHEVIALDRMPTMLARLQAKLEIDSHLKSQVRIVQADMTDIPLRSGSVGTVISPFNTLMHLYRWDQLLACFGQVRRVLRPGGAFAFDVQLPDTKWLVWDPEIRHAVTYFEHPRTGERMVYSTNHTYDPVTQICHIKLYYDDAPGRGRRFNARNPPPTTRAVVHLAHRQIYPEELRTLVTAAGLEWESVQGDFDDGELRRGSETQLVVCRKPAGPRG